MHAAACASCSGLRGTISAQNNKPTLGKACALRARPRAGLGIAGRIENNESAPETEQAFLEGGDFFPAGEDLALLGIGLRTNYNAARQLMDKDLLGTRRFAVVRDELDQSQDRMHLDCVFSILSDTCCLMLDTIMGAESGQRRLVDVWERKAGSKGSWGAYSLSKAKTGIEFAAFMQACPATFPFVVACFLSLRGAIPTAQVPRTAV